jgi:hypothetical protein
LAPDPKYGIAGQRLGRTSLTRRNVGGSHPPENHTAETKTAWLPFLDTYRTMCHAPEPGFRRILEDIRELHFD